MDGQAWSKEPWIMKSDKVGLIVIFDTEGNDIAINNGYADDCFDKVDLERIVACVNACRGIPSNLLEGMINCYLELSTKATGDKWSRELLNDRIHA